MPDGDLLFLYHDGDTWSVKPVSKRRTPFSLSGGGTKRIPISRPQLLIDHQDRLIFIYRDIERQNRVTLAVCEDFENNKWRVSDISNFSVGQWESCYDTELWKSANRLDIFVQTVGQGDLEQVENMVPQTVYILEWKLSIVPYPIARLLN